MDLDEWEFLPVPSDGFLDRRDGEDKILSSDRSSDQNSVFDMNYFICPSQSYASLPNQLVPLPLQFPENDPEEEPAKGVIIPKAPPPIATAVKPPELVSAEADQDMISQVFFKKMKENEFVDMKLDSPGSGTRASLPPPIDAAVFQFQDRAEAIPNSPRKNDMAVDLVAGDDAVNWEDHGGVTNIWKWGLTGIGAICSFGVAAAATVCIILLGNGHRNRHHHRPNNKLRFEIYADDKGIKQVVHHAAKLNEAISAARGIPIARAQITFGGYYEGL